MGNPQQCPFGGVLHDGQRARRPEAPVPDFLMDDRLTALPHRRIIADLAKRQDRY
jgi:hypothetical protein